MEVDSLGGGPAAPVAASTQFGVNETLADAITYMDADQGVIRTIEWPPALSGDTIHLTAQLPEITVPITFGGEDENVNGPARLTIDGGGSSEHLGSIFRVAPGATMSVPAGEWPGVWFSDLTLVNGYTTGNGAAIEAQSPVLVDDVTFSDNVATGPLSGGGAIYAQNLDVESGDFKDNSATVAGGAIDVTNGPGLELQEAVVTGNQSGGNGGGIAVDHAGLYISDSTISGNVASDDSGGIDIEDGTPRAGIYKEPWVIDSTIAENFAGYDGGGIGATGHTVLLQQDTIARNHAASGGGVLDRGASGKLLLQDTIDAANGAESHPDLVLQSGGRASATYSLIGDAGETGISASGENIVGTARHRVDPMLGPLKYNPGELKTPELETMLPLPHSPALDAGRNTAADTSTDELGHFRTISLGLKRPKGGDGTDIGAVELTLADLPQRTVTKIVGKRELKLSLPPSWVCVAQKNHYGPPSYASGPASYPLRLNSTAIPGFFTANPMPFVSARFALSGNTYRMVTPPTVTAVPGSVSIRYAGMKPGTHTASAAVTFATAKGDVHSTISATFKVC